MYVVHLAFRFLRKRAISGVALFITWLIVVLYLVIISVLEGFKAHHMDSLQSISAHLTVQSGNFARGMWRPEPWAEDLRRIPEVKGVTIGLEIPAMVIFDASRTIGTLRGVDLDRELEFGRMKELLTPSDVTEFGVHEVQGKKLPGCIVGSYWRRQHDLKVGDYATFLFTEENENADPVTRMLYIAGFFQSKDPYQENAAYVDRRWLAEQMGIPGNAKSLSVWVEGDPDRPDLDAIRQKVFEAADAAMARDIPELEQIRKALFVQTWREKGDNWYQAISIENLIMRFIMSIFLLFVIIIIMLILSRMVAEKVRDIGALRALGATPGGIMRLFLAQGLAISVLALALGLPAAWLFIGHINEVAAAAGINVFPKQAFFIDRIPTRLLPYDVWLISVLTLASGFVGALYPAWKAARLNPVECLRHE